MFVGSRMINHLWTIRLEEPIHSTLVFHITKDSCKFNIRKAMTQFIFNSIKIKLAILKHDELCRLLSRNLATQF